MKCQKCAKPAVVHLTEVITQTDGSDAGSGEARRAVEIHLCLNHAVEAGLLTPSPDAPPPTVIIKPEGSTASAGKPGSPKPSQDAEESSAIVPASGESSSLAVTRGGTTADPQTCPVCGISWSQFKQGGLMGCPHDYEQFGSKLVPLLKRAQEGATQHMGKVPRKKKTPHGDRQVMTLRLRRQLQHAVDVENYEQAAQLRDELRQLEQ
jgi:protein arginine kinase activator